MTHVQRPDLLAHALTAAARFPIIPLRPGSKTPAIDGWQHHATQDRGAVRRWWKRRPDQNIGICAGPHLLIVDLDVAEHGTTTPAGRQPVPVGVEQLRRLATQHGDQDLWGSDGMPRTYTVETPSSGWHLYLRVRDRACCRNTQQLLGLRIDTRGRGGYVVGAGSIGAHGLPYRAVVHRPIALAPAWLERALRPSPATVTPAAARPRVALRGAGAIDRWVRAAVRDECAVLARTAPGGRNAALLRAARILGELVGAGALTEETAAAALQEASAVHVGVDGFTEREAALTIRSGLGYGRQRPRDLGNVTGPTNRP